MIGGYGRGRRNKQIFLLGHVISGKDSDMVFSNVFQYISKNQIYAPTLVKRQKAGFWVFS